MLVASEFAELDAELAELTAMGDGRDDEEEARFAVLMELLHRT